MKPVLITLNLAMLVLYPMAWFAPLMRAGLLPLFGLSEVSVITGLQALWQTDVILGLIVTALAVFAPYLKTLGLALLHFDLLSGTLAPALSLLGKFAMADIFLIALYVVIFKGVGIGTIEIAWGLYFFTALIMASLLISWATEHTHMAPGRV